VNIGEDQGRFEELGNTTSKNLSGYGGRYVEKVVSGTGDTLLCPFFQKGERKPISIYEMVDCKEGGGEGRSTEYHNDNTTLCREGPLLCS
jgi:hypothetical protein